MIGLQKRYNPKDPLEMYGIPGLGIFRILSNWFGFCFLFFSWKNGFSEILSLTPNVGFIDDFGLDELFDDIFEGAQSDRFVEGIAFSFTVDPLDEGHVTLVTLFELFKYNIQRHVLEDEVARILVELAQCLQRSGIFRIHQRQLFDEQQRDDVRTLTLVDRDTRKSCRFTKS